MNKFIPVFASALMLSTAAIAQTAAPADPASPSPAAPAERMETPSTDTMTPAPAATPSADTSASAASDALTLTDAEAEAWVGKTVYGSDDENLGEVAAIDRDPSGKVNEIHADIGGFLGLGETRVRVMPTEFKLVNDRVVLSATGDQAKNLPKVVAE